MKGEGYGADYRYLHDDGEDERMNDRYLPEGNGGRIYYEPKESGAEAGMKERVERWRRNREAREE